MTKKTSIIIIIIVILIIIGLIFFIPTGDLSNDLIFYLSNNNENLIKR